MAKEVTLTVKVDDREFDAFVKKYEDFAGKIKGLLDATKSADQSKKDQEKAAQQTVSHMQNMLNVSKSIHGTIKEITNHFGKWATLIGGTVMMLGGGAGMFGIDRLLNRFIQQQRTAMGLGMGFSQAQPTMTMGGLFPGSPEAILRNIQIGLNDPASRQRVGLQAMGIYDPNAKPEELYKKALKALVDPKGRVQTAPPGAGLTVAGAARITDIVGEAKVLEALKNPQEILREIAAIEAMEKRVPKITPEETEKLDKLKTEWSIFTATVGVRLTQGLAAIAPALTFISKGMTAATPQSGLDVLSMLVNPLGYGLSKGAIAFGHSATGQETKNKIIEWSNDLQKFLGGPIQTFKERMEELNKTIWELITKLNVDMQGIFTRMWNWMTGNQPGGPGAAGGAHPAVPAAPGAHGGPRAVPTPAPAPAPAAPAAPATPGGPAPTGPAPQIPGVPVPNYGPFGSSTSIGGSSRFASFGGNQQLAALFGGAGGSSRFGMSIAGGNNRISMAGGSFSGGNTNIGGSSSSSRVAFASAAQRARPGANNLGMMFNRQSSVMMAGLGGRALGGRGPLDSDNWQHSRVASLTIRDVPGSNIHTSAQGMA